MPEVRTAHLLIALGIAILFVMFLQSDDDAWTRCTTHHSDATCVVALQR